MSISRSHYINFLSYFLTMNLSANFNQQFFRHLSRSIDIAPQFHARLNQVNILVKKLH